MPRRFLPRPFLPVLVASLATSATLPSPVALEEALILRSETMLYRIEKP